MHATVMVITPIGRSLDDNLMKYSQNAEPGDGSGACFVYYSHELYDVTPGDSPEELMENYKKETGKDMDPDEYYANNLDGYYDWYSVGGRWAGFFKAVDNPSERAQVGEKSWTNEKLEIAADRIDYGLVSDIDWLGMSRDLLKELTPGFEVIWKAIEDLPLLDFTHQAETHIENQPRALAVSKMWEESDLVKEVYSWISNNWKLLNLPIEEALEEVAVLAFSTYSLIYNGEWYDKDDFEVSMGDKIAEIIKDIFDREAQDKYMVYLVDYHS